MIDEEKNAHPSHDAEEATGGIESNNSTATPQVNVDESIKYLASLKPTDFDRIRKSEAKRLGLQVKTLDRLVDGKRHEEDEISRRPFPDVEPYHEPVHPADLLNEISETIRRFIVLDIEQADAAALWILFTWVIEEFDVAPLAIINAPEKACGKSLMLDLFGKLSSRPLPASNATAASLFRAIEHWKPTMLIDEADTFVRDNDEFKGMINAGHTRANAYVLRVVGENYEPRMFSVWGAKALAGIALERHLPASTMSRAIVFNLRRKMPHESVSRLRHADPNIFTTLVSKLARVAEEYSEVVRLARPALPEELGDRSQDNWEPLLAIAECAGQDWTRRAETAARKLSATHEDPASTGNELLADIYEIFGGMTGEKISTVQLINALTSDDEKSWSTYNRGKPLTPRQLAKQLGVYGIKSKTVRMGHANTPKGYDRLQFEDAFARYLAPPQKMPQLRNDSPGSINGIEGGVADGSAKQLFPIDQATQKPIPPVDCVGDEDSSTDADKQTSNQPKTNLSR